MSAAVSTATAARRAPLLTRERILGVVYLVLAAVMVLVFAAVKTGAQTTFGLNLGLKPAIPMPDLVVPSAVLSYVLGALCAALGVIQLVRGFGRRWTLVLGLVALCFTASFLTWAAAGKSVSLVGILQSTLLLSVPITFGALSGVLCERSGVINIAIEGMLLAGAFTAAVVASIAGSNWIGLLAAILVGALLAWLLAVLAIRYLVDQIIAGTVINILALGITSFLSARVLQTNANLNSPTLFNPFTIPVLGDIPIIGPIAFRQNLFVYALFILVVVINFALFRTRWGLRVRAVGEHPEGRRHRGHRCPEDPLPERHPGRDGRRTGRRVLHARERGQLR